ncbi:MFS transporter [Streptomyces violascens]|uniref:MFS transporter n=1 Tax=Streptomyces violascens TaxID=67381 RepID=A0ABQ3QEI2_9ACTN|nr:MFS transporter [Streptomyces violascens]GGU00871.1 MFS transporter [Streptomyces violascens]GHI35665.1 MFS transporter [Streptomyces violascens]
MLWVARFKELPLALRVLFLASFVNRAGMFVFPLLAVYLVRGKDLSPGEAGLLISIGSTGLLVGSLLSGPLCDLRGRRTALLSALILNAAGYLGLALLDGAPWTYAALLFVALVGMGMFSPASNTLVADLTTPEQRPFAYTISYVGNNLGMGVGPLLGGVAAAYSYHVMFAGNILAGLLCAAMITLWVPRDRRTKNPEDVNPLKKKGGSGPLGHHHVLLLVLVSFFYVVPLIGLEYALPLAVTTVLHDSAGLVGAVYTINSVVVVSLGLLMEKHMRGYGTKTLLMVAGLLWTLGLCVIVFGFSLPALLLSTVVWTLGEIIVSVVVPTYVADHVDERRVGSFMALNGFVLGLARLVVPVGLGVLWSADGYRPVFVTLLLAPLIGMAGFALLRIRPSAALKTGADPQSEAAPANTP